MKNVSGKLTLVRCEDLIINIYCCIVQDCFGDGLEKNAGCGFIQDVVKAYERVTLYFKKILVCLCETYNSFNIERIKQQQRIT